MNIRPIKTETEYQTTLSKIRELWGCTPNTSEGDLFEVLCMLVEKYEQEHYPIEPLDPIEAIKYEMEENNWTQSELAKRLNISKSRMSEVLNRKRPIPFKMAKILYKDFKIPAESLLL